MSENKPGLVIVNLVILAVALGTGVVVFLASRPSDPTVTNTGPVVVEGQTSDDGVTIYDPSPAVQDFTLPGSTGQPVSLSDLRGKYVLLFFGYTHCPDICPMTMLEYKQIKNKLGDDADEVAFVYISVDGERDTPEVMAAFLARFDTSFIGLTGDDETLKRIGPDYNLYYEKQYGTGSKAEYLVVHTANMFLLDREGRLVRKFPFGTDPDVVTKHIRELL